MVNPIVIHAKEGIEEPQVPAVAPDNGRVKQVLAAWTLPSVDLWAAFPAGPAPVRKRTPLLPCRRSATPDRRRGATPVGQVELSPPRRGIIKLEIAGKGRDHSAEPAGQATGKSRTEQPPRHCPAFIKWQLARSEAARKRVPRRVREQSSARSQLCSRQTVSALGRGVTADPIAINDMDLAAVEPRRRFRVHLAMWEADRTGMWPEMYASRERASITTMAARRP